jgi:hypothetical protein
MSAIKSLHALLTVAICLLDTSGAWAHGGGGGGGGGNGGSGGTGTGGGGNTSAPIYGNSQGMDTPPANQFAAPNYTPCVENDCTRKTGEVDWIAAGTATEAYDYVSFGSELHIDSKQSTKPDDFVTLLHKTSVKAYRGKRVRVQAFMMPRNVRDGAGMWCRIDDANGNAIVFDDMHAHPILGSRNWTRYEIVVDVPQNAYLMAYGFLLMGQGQLMISRLRVSIVPQTVPLTSSLAGPITQPEQTTVEIGSRR